MKIYVHHYFSNTLFYKLAHNTTDRVFNVVDRVGVVFCKYNNIKIEFVFDPIWNDNKDGYHLIDFFTILLNIHNKSNDYKDYDDISYENGIEDSPVVERFAELLKDKSDWLITIFRTEKLLAKKDVRWHLEICELEEHVLKLKNHKIITDNFLFYPDSDYSNIHYTFTNTIHQWNEIVGIRWYYEYSQLYNKLNFDYDMCYSVRNYKTHRMDILKGLNDLNNDKILLLRSNHLDHTPLYKKHLIDISKCSNIKTNDIVGYNDFDDLRDIQNITVGLDLFIRVLSKAKMQVLDESWAFCEHNFLSQYLSEKTIGLVLSGIPFVSTHSYPLAAIQKILDIPPHPFYEDFVYHKGNSEKFVMFIKRFMENFDYNYELCKEWSVICKNKFIEKLEKENNLLDLIIGNFETNNRIFKKGII